MTYRREDKIAAYEAAREMIEADPDLLNQSFGIALAAVFKMLKASTKLDGTECRQVAAKALRTARHARQVDILADSLGECREANHDE